MARWITVEPVVFVMLFGKALLNPLLQQYIYDQLSIEYNFTKKEENELCVNGTKAGRNITSLESRIQTESANWFLVLNLCTCIPSFISCLFLGSLSDMIGRKPTMLITMVGSFFNFVIIAITVTFDFPFYVVFLGSFIEGLTGSFAGIISSCLAYLIDITDQESRAWRFGVFEAAEGLGSAISFSVAGVWLKVAGYAQPLWGGSGLLFLCCLYIIFLLPESLVNPTERISRNSFVVQLKRIKDFAVAKRGRHIKTCFLLLLIGYMFAVLDYFGSITILFVKHFPLCWGPDLIGYYLAAKVGAASVGLIFGFKVLAKIFTECVLVIIACVFFVVFNVMTGFATTTAAMFLTCIPALLVLLAPPCIRSIASKMVDKHEEGTLCSILAITEALTEVISPLMLNFLYPVGLTKLHASGFVFFVEAGLLLVPITFFSIIYYLSRKHSHILNATFKEDTDSILVQA